MTVGDRIKEHRSKLNLRQNELAAAAGITKQALYKYENNIITNIPSDKIEAISKALKISPASLMGWDDLEHNSEYNMKVTLEERKVIEKLRTADYITKGAILKLLNVYIDEADKKEAASG